MHEQRVRFVLRARELGFWLDEIRALLSLVDERDRPCAEARAVAPNHLQDVRAKIADLKRMEHVLKDVVAQCGDGTPPECPFIEALFQGITHKEAEPRRSLRTEEEPLSMCSISASPNCALLYPKPHPF